MVSARLNSTIDFSLFFPLLQLPQFTLSSDLEVQERACSFLQLMTVVQKLRGKGAQGIGEEMALLFDGELKPVAPKAQKKVCSLSGLEL